VGPFKQQKQIAMIALGDINKMQPMNLFPFLERRDGYERGIPEAYKIVSAAAD
jgi:hypothetical protein